MVVNDADPSEEMSEQEYRRFALGDPQGLWELHQGRLREKPPMSAHHGNLRSHLGVMLQTQLDRREFRVRFGHARLRISPENYYIPDIAVIPSALDPMFHAQPEVLDAYAAPLPLVGEVWSPSTGGYDVETKVPEYRSRGDLEIWQLHPRERTLTTWVRQAGGVYAQATYSGGVVRPSALPGVAINLDALFGA